MTGNLPLPQWAYVPGEAYEADADYETLAQVKLLVPPALWAAAPQGGRERILLRACILVANGNLRLRMEKGGSAARLFGEALVELRALGLRKATASGDGFADGFPIEALAAILKARIERPQFSKADWVKFAIVIR